MNTLVLIGALAFSVIFIWLVVKNKILIFWFTFIAVFLPTEYIARFFMPLPAVVRLMPQLLVIVCTGLTVIFFRQIKARVPLYLIVSYILFLVVALFSMFYNDTSLGELIYAQRGFIFVIGMLIIFKIIYTKFTLDDIYTFIVKAGFVMAGLALFERVVLVSILRVNSGDMITGTFSNDNQYLLFQLVCTVIVIGYWVAGKKLTSLSPGNTLLIFIGSIAIANNKAGILFVGAILLFFVFQLGYKVLFHHLGKMVYLLFFIFIGAYMFEFLFTSFYVNSAKKGSYAYLTDIDYMKDYMFGESDSEGKFSKSGTLRRGAAIEFSYDLIKRDPFSLLLGKGPGSTLVKADNTGGYINNKYPGYNIGRTAISWLLCETGVLGLIIYFCMLLAIYFSKNHKGRKEYKVIKNTIVLLLFSYAAYENTIVMLVNALIITVIIFPNFEHYFTKTKKAVTENKEENEVQPSPYFTMPSMR